MQFVPATAILNARRPRCPLRVFHTTRVTLGRASAEHDGSALPQTVGAKAISQEVHDIKEAANRGGLARRDFNDRPLGYSRRGPTHWLTRPATVVDRQALDQHVGWHGRNPGSRCERAVPR